MHRRVVVSGLGAISPVGNNVPEFWDSLVKGKSGIADITLFDCSDQKVKIAGEVKDFDIEDYFDRKDSRALDRFAAFSLLAADEAISGSEVDISSVDPNRAGIILGSGIGGIITFQEQHTALMEGGPRRVSPFFIPKMIADIAPGLLSIKYGFKGVNYAATSACASASHAIGMAFHHIRAGHADLIITGGSEAAISRMALAGFANMKALSMQNDEPETASKPFDARRDGFVIAEGAGVLILESLDHALRRNAPIFAEIVGVGFSSDAYHITAPDPEGDGAFQAMRTALQDASLSLADTDYINTHGTSTPFNDRIETAAIKRLFGDHAKELKLSSTKSMTGHLLGASGAVEAIALVKSITDGIIPPTINYTTPDPECDLDYTPNKSVQWDVNVGLSNTFGFGGHNAVIALKKYHQ